jgi:hypothetical protein
LIAASVRLFLAGLKYRNVIEKLPEMRHSAVSFALKDGVVGMKSHGLDSERQLFDA